MAAPRQYFFIKSKLNGMVLDIKERRTSPGAEVHTWLKRTPACDNQLWYVHTETGTIRSKMNHLCFEITGNGRLIMNNPDPGSTDQQWSISDQHIRNGKDPSKALDIEAANTKKGAKIVAWKFHGKVNQCWTFEDIEGRNVSFRSPSPSPVPDPVASHVADDATKSFSQLSIANQEPTYWDKDVGYENGFVRIALTATSQEYLCVRKKFTNSGGPDTVQKIERIQNKDMFQRYLLIAQQLKEKRPWLPDVEKGLYHGTPNSVIDGINKQGFDKGFAGKNATVYGKGNYFAVQAKYSCRPPYSVADENGLKYVYQCRALVGQPCQGRQGMIQPDPLSEDHPKELHDSAVDDLERPNMYVVFRDDRAYPEYLITYR